MVQESKKVGEGSVQIAAVTRENLMLSLGDSTKAYQCDNVKTATRAVILPFSDSMGGLTADEIHNELLVPYLQGGEGEEAPYRPIVEGDLIRLKHGAQFVEMKVMELEPSHRCIVAPETELDLPERELNRAEEAEEEELGYDDIGGCDKELAKIRELVELPMRHPQGVHTRGRAPAARLRPHLRPARLRQDHDRQGCRRGDWRLLLPHQRP